MVRGLLLARNMSDYASRTRFALLLGAGLTLVGCISEPTEPSATPHADPADYLITPAGYYHKDCVYDVGDDATVEDSQVIHADGRVEALPPCTHPSYASREDLEAGLPRLALDAEEADLVEPSTTGWLSSLGKGATRGGGGHFRKFNATWTVPAYPSHFGGQTIFLFPGFEPGNGASIAQPVLAYLPQNATIGFWWIGSWWCTNKYGCPHSALKWVFPGDIIDGTVAGSQCSSSGVCTWTITMRDRRSAQSTTLVRRDPSPMNWVVTALEVENLASCSELPSSGAEGFTMNVQNGNGSWSVAPWSKFHSTTPPNCHYDESTAGPSHTYLFWSH
jgi:hypothetical protein